MKLFHYGADILNDICLAVKSNNLVILKQSNFMFIQKFTYFDTYSIYPQSQKIQHIILMLCFCILNNIWDNILSIYVVSLRFHLIYYLLFYSLSMWNASYCYILLTYPSLIGWFGWFCWFDWFTCSQQK